VTSLFHGTAVLNKTFLVYQMVVAVSFVVTINFLHFVKYLMDRMRETRRILKRDFPYFSNLRF
jgi:hypothetical protein